MKRFLLLLTAIGLTTAFNVGCDNKATTERKETVTTPGGTTTTTDTHTVKSTGDNPPATSSGEKAN